MTLSNRNGAFALAALTALGSCGPAPLATTSENTNYNAQRTRLEGVPTDCTIYTSEEGRVYQGTAVFTGGTARRDCVASTDEDQRRMGTGRALGDIRSTIYDVRSTVRAAEGLIDVFNFSEQNDGHFAISRDDLQELAKAFQNVTPEDIETVSATYNVSQEYVEGMIDTVIQSAQAQELTHNQ